MSSKNENVSVGLGAKSKFNSEIYSKMYSIILEVHIWDPSGESGLASPKFPTITILPELK